METQKELAPEPVTPTSGIVVGSVSPGSRGTGPEVDEEMAWAEVTVKETALVQVRDSGERLVRERADLCGCEVGPM